jgi:1-acyl-sn-glycerol-3-phosphate acyltransferase
MRVPPTPIRRLALAPLVLLLEVLVLLASPLLFVLAVVASPLFGGWRPVRVLAIALVYAARHVAATLACFGLWVASGFGLRTRSPAMQRAHYAVLRWFVNGVYRTAVALARVDVRMVESDDAEAALAARGRPALVFSRHAGEGDTFLVIQQLLCRHGRRPRVVMHRALQLDPLIDVMGRRLPNRFVDPRGGDTEVEIAAMSRELGSQEAVLIFPEGANFTPERRQRGIERLERGGHDEEAGWAREMQHVIPPRPGGALAAIEAAPGADVVFMGHVGFPGSLGDLWRQLPFPQTVEVRLWTVPAEEIPADRDERIDWLFGWWRTLDAWVGERQDRPVGQS